MDVSVPGIPTANLVLAPNPDYPATKHIPMKASYLARIVVICVVLTLFGAWAAVFFRTRAATPTVYGAILAAICSVYLVAMLIGRLRRQFGVTLDGDGFTDSTFLAAGLTIRIRWSNVRVILVNEINTHERLSTAYVRIHLTDSSVFKSYSWVKRMLVTSVYRTSFRAIRIGLYYQDDSILTQGTSLDAQQLADLMNSYLLAWHESHHRSSHKRETPGQP